MRFSIFPSHWRDTRKNIAQLSVARFPGHLLNKWGSLHNAPSGGDSPCSSANGQHGVRRHPNHRLLDPIAVQPVYGHVVVEPEGVEYF